MQELYFDNKLGIIGLKGKVLKIVDKNMDKKLACLEEILKKLMQLNNENESNIPIDWRARPGRLFVMILVPEKLVSCLIGIKGK